MACMDLSTVSSLTIRWYVHMVSRGTVSSSHEKILNTCYLQYWWRMEPTCMVNNRRRKSSLAAFGVPHAIPVSSITQPCPSLLFTQSISWLPRERDSPSLAGSWRLGLLGKHGCLHHLRCFPVQWLQEVRNCVHKHFPLNPVVENSMSM